MVKGSQLVEEVFDSESLISEVLHVNFALHLIHKVDSWGQHAHPPNAVHAFNFLQDALPRQLFVQSGHSVLLREALLDDTSLAEKFTQVDFALGTLRQKLDLILISLVFNHFLVSDSRLLI